MAVIHFSLKATLNSRNGFDTIGSSKRFATLVDLPQNVGVLGWSSVNTLFDGLGELIEVNVVISTSLEKWNKFIGDPEACWFCSESSEGKMQSLYFGFFNYQEYACNSPNNTTAFIGPWGHNKENKKAEEQCVVHPWNR